MPLAAAIRLMLEEDAKIPGQLLTELRRIEQVIKAITEAFTRGGPGWAETDAAPAYAAAASSSSPSAIAST